MTPSLSEGVRVLALPFVRIRPGDVVVCKTPRSDNLTIKRVVGIEKGQVRIEGDHLLRSTDSRHFGPVDMEDLIARVWCQIAPDWKVYL